MENEITINGEVYVRKEIKLSENELFKAKPWPQEGDEYYLVGPSGKISKGKYVGISEDDLIKFGNFFRTKEEAHMYALRIESLSKGFVPEKDEEFWIWDFQYNKPRALKGESFFWIYFMVVKFPTEEACQEWYNEFGKSWEYLID